MAKKKVQEVKEVIENINISSLDNLMGDDYSIYAEEVIKNRAIPDARDGLKPVQRRIIYSMYVNGNTDDKPTRKSARIVGDVIGKFHPHGDSSAYEALVRMSQPWKTNIPLISFQGNNGSIDGDGPAANRYTEARLSKISNLLVENIEKNTVETVLNFDDTLLEPVVLPAKFPNLFLNGSEGIAVALATDIPPHNLKEICDAAIYRISHKTCSIDDLLEIVKGPDFPTGGIIYSSDSLKEIYKTGKGKIEVASKADIIEENGTKQIVITEIPFRVIKKDLVYAIERIKHFKQIYGITNVIDATEMNELKIIVELEKDAKADLILNYLFNKTDLKTYYTANMYAIVEGRPQLLTLESYLDCFIKFQEEIYTKECKYDLEKAKTRLNVVNGLIKAISILDEVIKTIKSSLNKQDAKNNLIIKYDFNEEQAEAIVMLQLYRLSNTDITKLEEESTELNKTINNLTLTLADKKRIDRGIIGNLKSIISNFSVDRRTVIVEKKEEVVIDQRDLIIQEDVYVSITEAGYVKRSSLKSQKSSSSILPGIREGDRLVCADISNTKDYILGFTNKGNYIQISVNDILENKWKEEGKHINYLINLPFEEKIIKCISVEEFNPNVMIISITKKGQIKRTRLSEFFAQRTSKPIQMMKMMKNDELVDVCVSTGNDNLLIFTSDGNVTYFNENELNVLGNKTSGVKSINNLKEAKIVSMLNYKPGNRSKILLITDRGYKKIILNEDFELTPRLGKISKAFKIFKSDKQSLIYTRKIEKEEPFTIYMRDDSNSIKELLIEDFKLVRTEYANSDSSLKFNYNSAYNFDIFHVTRDIKIDKIIKDEEKEENTSESNFSHVSIFEDFDD